MPDEKQQIEVTINDDVFPKLVGVGDQNLRYLEEKLNVKISARGGKIIIESPADNKQRLKRVFNDLEALLKERDEVNKSDLDTILRLAGFNGQQNSPLDKSNNTGLELEVPRGVIKPKGQHQANYLQLMVRNTIVFAIGPAGTGKTYLAVAMAVDQFIRRQVEKIILVRPVVESGETLGYLPGDILEKVDPYFRPLYDALDEMLTADRVKRFIDRGIIEIAPLAYMRGRTLNNAFVILDEAQNTTSGQMKMFLTRLGHSSRAVLTGDLTQIDIPDPSKSGLLEAQDLLRGIEGIAFVEFDDTDVVRHRLVSEILKAYQNGRENLD